MELCQDNIPRDPVSSSERVSRWLMKWNEPTDEDLLAVQDLQTQALSHPEYDHSHEPASTHDPFNNRLSTTDSWPTLIHDDACATMTHIDRDKFDLALWPSPASVNPASDRSDRFTEADNPSHWEQVFDNILTSSSMGYTAIGGSDRNYPLTVETATSSALETDNGMGALQSSDKTKSDTNAIAAPRSHAYYGIQAEKGEYHCPFALTENCAFQPERLPCRFFLHLDSHLKPYRCGVVECSHLQFSSVAVLYRHERQIHPMHRQKTTFPCPYKDCERVQANRPFARRWNLMDHMKRIHQHADTDVSSPLPPPSYKNLVQEGNDRTPYYTENIERAYDGTSSWGYSENKKNNPAPASRKRKGDATEERSAKRVDTRNETMLLDPMGLVGREFWQNEAMDSWYFTDPQWGLYSAL